MRAIPVAILIFDGVEVLDFCGPFEVFSIAREAGSDIPAFRVFTVAEKAAIITATGGLRVEPACTTLACPPVEILIVPGGQGTRREVDNSGLIDWLRERASVTPVVASVCTGAFLLARAGLLDGKRATTHWASVERLGETFPQVRVVADERVVDEGRIATSAGVSAGIDMALGLVCRLCGPEVASSAARRMEYEIRTT